MSGPYRTPEDVAAEWGMSRLKLVRFCRKHEVPILDLNGTLKFDEIAIRALEDAKEADRLARIVAIPHDEIVDQSLSWAALSHIYFLIRDEVVCYVGQSINVHQRIDEHRKRKKYDRVHIIPCAVGDLDIVEAAFIRKFRPVDNRDRWSDANRYSEVMNDAGSI